jgi:hypothetical protein
MNRRSVDERRDILMRSQAPAGGASSAPSSRRFTLIREVDVSAVSGVGRIAEGVEFSDGSVALRWHSRYPATAVWGGIDEVLAIHGHAGLTKVSWLGPPAAIDPERPR